LSLLLHPSHQFPSRPPPTPHLTTSFPPRLYPPSLANNYRDPTQTESRPIYRLFTYIAALPAKPLPHSLVCFWVGSPLASLQLRPANTSILPPPKSFVVSRAATPTKPAYPIGSSRLTIITYLPACDGVVIAQSCRQPFASV